MPMFCGCNARVKRLVRLPDQKPLSLPIRMPRERPAARNNRAPFRRSRSARTASRTEPSRLPLSFLVISSRASIPLSVQVKPPIASALPLRPVVVEACSSRSCRSVRTRPLWSCSVVCGLRRCATPRSTVVFTALSDARDDPHPAGSARLRTTASTYVRRIETGRSSHLGVNAYTRR